MIQDDLAHRWPSLFTGHTWGRTSFLGMRLLDGPIDVSILQSVNIVPFVGEDVVLTMMSATKPLLPGGTREYGETLLQTIQREVFEECGAEIDTCVAFALLDCYSYERKPWRPHLPHPEFSRLLCFGDIRMIGGPARGQNMETISAVNVVSLPVAIRSLLTCRRPELAAIYECAAEARGDGETGVNLISHPMGDMI